MSVSYECQKWARSQNIGGSPKMILVTLSLFVNNKYQCWPSYKTLAFETGLSVKTVERALKKLEDDGFVHIERRKIKHTHLYTFPKSYTQVNQTLCLVSKNKPDILTNKPDTVSLQTRHHDVLTPKNSHIESFLIKKQEEQKMYKWSYEEQSVVDQAFDPSQTEVEPIVQLIRQSPLFAMAQKARSAEMRSGFQKTLYWEAKHTLEGPQE